MKANNAVATTAKNKSFSTVINSPNCRAMIDKSVGDPRRAASLVSTLIYAVNSTPALQECNVGTVISAALRGEIGMNLSLALGQYSIVPYGDRAQFIISANGLKQLAIRSGTYSAIGFFDVRDGEYKGRDRRTREPVFEWVEDEDVRETLPIIGYYGFYRLNEKYNNFFQCIYWSHDKILRHADRYSKAFSLAKYEAMLAGKLEPWEVKKLQGGSPWYGDPNSLAHQKMCEKTIAKQLLGDGMAPKEIQEAIQADNMEEETGEPVTYAGDAVFDIPEPAEAAPDAPAGEKNAAEPAGAPEPEAPQTPRQKRMDDAPAQNYFFGE